MSASGACLCAVLISKEFPGRDLEGEDLIEVNSRPSLSRDEKPSPGVDC